MEAWLESQAVLRCCCLFCCSDFGWPADISAIFSSGPADLTPSIDNGARSGHHWAGAEGDDGGPGREPRSRMDRAWNRRDVHCRFFIFANFCNEFCSLLQGIGEMFRGHVWDIWTSLYPGQSSPLMRMAHWSNWSMPPWTILAMRMEMAWVEDLLRIVRKAASEYLKVSIPVVWVSAGANILIMSRFAGRILRVAVVAPFLLLFLHCGFFHWSAIQCSPQPFHSYPPPPPPP